MEKFFDQNDRLTEILWLVIEDSLSTFLSASPGAA
jgi:hypothetical protein